ncbi:hypothetical protein BC826DRAFT_1077494, partial [Russula brevipes]
MWCSPFFVASSMELMSHNIRTNTALYPDCSPTALPLDWYDGCPKWSSTFVSGRVRHRHV